MSVFRGFLMKKMTWIVAMVLSAFASTASAQEQSAEDQQLMINDLLAQVSALQSQTGNGGGKMMSATGPASVCVYPWTRNLTPGTTGMDVMKLQQFLNADPDTRVAAAGSIGSAGMETTYYGPATGAAVAKYQMKYRAEILTPLGLVAATQFFGPSTRAHVNSMCSVASLAVKVEMETALTKDCTREDGVRLRKWHAINDQQAGWQYVHVSQNGEFIVAEESSLYAESLISSGDGAVIKVMRAVVDSRYFPGNILNVALEEKGLAPWEGCTS